jgi:ABC-type Zn uptake system ZnuABC Zn-binding protein ZnuA
MPGSRAIVTSTFFERFARFDCGGSVRSGQSGKPGDAVERLAQLFRDQGIAAVFSEHGYDDIVMGQVAAAAGVPLCTLYSDIMDGAMTYEQMMHANADEIVRCLGA